MKKTIKFDLPIDGVKVATLEDLRSHFTTEILDHFDSGLLGKWLRSRQLHEKADEIERLPKLDREDKTSTLKALCRIFGIDADDDVVEAAVEHASGERGILVKEQLSSSKDFSSWLLWWVHTFVDLEVTKTVSQGVMDFPKLKISSFERLKHNSTFGTKEHWNGYLRHNMVLWSMVVGFFDKCPEVSFSRVIIKYGKHRVSSCIACYRLSQDEHDFVLESLLSTFSMAYNEHMFSLSSYGSFTSLFNELQEEGWMDYGVYRSFVGNDDEKGSITADNLRELKHARLRLRRASNLLNKSLIKMHSVMDFIDAFDESNVH